MGSTCINPSFGYVGFVPPPFRSLLSPELLIDNLSLEDLEALSAQGCSHATPPTAESILGTTTSRHMRHMT